MSRTRASLSDDLSALTIFTCILTLFTALSGCSPRQKSLDNFQVEHPLPLAWNAVSPGLFQAVLQFHNREDNRDVELIAVKAGINAYRLKLLAAPVILNQPGAWLPEIHDRSGAAVSINAGYFQPDFQPTGLLVVDGKALHPFNPHDGSGILSLKDGRPEIVWATQFKPADSPDIDALQVGPLLIEPGGKFGMKNNKSQFTARSAICLNASHEAIFVATARSSDNNEARSGLDLYELARILHAAPKEGGLGCTVALNLDGGVSTQLKVTLQGFKYEIKGESKISNAIGLFPR